MTNREELVRRLRLMADQGDFGRPPDPTDIRRQAADFIEQSRAGVIDTEEAEIHRSDCGIYSEPPSPCDCHLVDPTVPPPSELRPVPRSPAAEAFFSERRRAAIRADALEEAAKAVELYAEGPTSELTLTCDCIASAIRSLKKDSHDG